jgi:hypothetical protein
VHNKPVLHGDQGSARKATTVLAMLQRLGVKPSYSRPRVSRDNASAESLFRTAKYRPEYPAKGFASLDETRAWAAEFVRWYNVDHRHSGIGYVSPQQRHAGDDQAILAARHALYTQARQRNPARWSGSTRDWSHIGAVTLNPECHELIRRGPQRSTYSASGCVTQATTTLTRTGNATRYGWAFAYPDTVFISVAGYIEFHVVSPAQTHSPTRRSCHEFPSRSRYGQRRQARRKRKSVPAGFCDPELQPHLSQ